MKLISLTTFLIYTENASEGHNTCYMPDLVNKNFINHIYSYRLDEYLFSNINYIDVWYISDKMVSELKNVEKVPWKE